MTYMDHIITMHAQKGPLVGLEYDYRFRVRRERTGAPWNVFNYSLYSSVKAKCKTKAANTSVTSHPFRDYITKSKRPHSLRFCYNFNKGRCSKRDCNYTHGCSFCKKESHSQLVCKAKLAYNRTHYKAPLKQPDFSTGASNTVTQPASTTKIHVLPTQVKPNVLTLLLQGYYKNLTNALVTCFTDGFRIPSSIPSDPPKHEYENHRSVRDNLDIVQQKLNKEKVKHRIAGPFVSDPFPNMVYSPLGLVPKREQWEFRLIHDLSFPKTNTVYSHTLPEFTAVTFKMLDHCVEQLLSLGKGAYIAKADLQGAFRIIPVSPLDYKLLGFKFQGQNYFDLCLPMGVSHTCRTFELLSQALQWICQHKFHISHMSHILDDFIFFGKTLPDCHSSLSRFFELSNMVNLPIKQSKTVFPSTTVTLHGIEVDTVNQTLALPPEKVASLRQKLINLAKRKKTTLKEMQSLIGSLNFACRAIAPGRAFLRRLNDLTRENSVVLQLQRVITFLG